MKTKSLTHPILLIGILLLCIFVLNSVSAGQIYQWRDDKGQLHFGDKPPAKAKSKQVTVKINTFERVEIVDLPGSKQPQKSKKKSQKTGGSVVMYSTTWCGVCKKAKRYFNQNGISYTEYDVEKSAKGKSDFKAMNGTGVPIILIGDARMYGFSPARFERLYFGGRR